MAELKGYKYYHPKSEGESLEDSILGAIALAKETNLMIGLTKGPIEVAIYPRSTPEEVNGGLQKLILEKAMAMMPH